jgi:hypothetical protein
VSVLLNNGDGTFAAHVLYGAGTTPGSVAVGDLDGDGDLDLAVTNFESDNVSVLLHADGDCNGNGVPDDCDIANGTSADCNANGIPDECDLASDNSADCNSNGTPDECEPDCNGNGTPDECDMMAPAGGVYFVCGQTSDFSWADPAPFLTTVISSTTRWTTSGRRSRIRALSC